MNRIKLSPETLALRKATFEELCRKSSGDLIDAESADIEGQLTLPQKLKSKGSSQPPEIDYGVTALVYIVEKSGEISWISILQSSGNSDLDSFVASIYSGSKFERPAMRGKEPARVFITNAITHCKARLHMSPNSSLQRTVIDELQARRWRLEDCAPSAREQERRAAAELSR